MMKFWSGVTSVAVVLTLFRSASGTPLRQTGWNDPFSAFLEAVRFKEGMANRDDLATALL